MRKFKVLICVLILLSSIILGLMATARGNNYSLGLTVGDMFIWEVKELNLEPVEGTEIRVPSIGEDADKGEKTSAKITKIDELSDKWSVTVYATQYAIGDIEDAPSKSEVFTIEKEPVPEMETHFFIPIPVGDYLEVVYGGKEDTEISGNTVVSEVIHPTVSIRFELAYESTFGALDYMKFEYNDELLLHLDLISAVKGEGTENGGALPDIPGYDVYILLMISTLGAVCIVLYTKIKTRFYS